jgi:hypothetical protein
MSRSEAEEKIRKLLSTPSPEYRPPKNLSKALTEIDPSTVRWYLRTHRSLFYFPKTNHYHHRRRE